MQGLSNYKLKENVILKNRFVLAPMTTYSGNDDLTLSDAWFFFEVQIYLYF